jgi:hypothetical protein
MLSNERCAGGSMVLFAFAGDQHQRKDRDGMWSHPALWNASSKEEAWGGTLESQILLARWMRSKLPDDRETSGCAGETFLLRLILSSSWNGRVPMQVANSGRKLKRIQKNYEIT